MHVNDYNKQIWNVKVDNKTWNWISVASVLSHMKYLMVKTLAGIVPSIPLELGFSSLQISHTSCCPFFVRVPPITTMGGYVGSCPSFLRVLPITGMGRMPWKMPFWSQGPPNNGYGRTPFSSQGPSNNRHGRTPFSSQGPSNNRHGRTPRKMPCVSPGPSSNYYGTLAFFFPLFRR